MIEIIAKSRKFPLKRPFKISRASKTHAEVVEVCLRIGNTRAFAECVPYSRYEESVSSVLTQIKQIALPANIPKAFLTLDRELSPGAAKNALNCALWSLWAAEHETPLHQFPPFLQQLSSDYHYPNQIETCRTISVDEIDVMAQETRELGDPTWLKIKLDADDIIDKVQAIHQVSPKANLVIDANEAWNIEILNKVSPALSSLPVRLIEQPLPSGEDPALVEYSGSLIVCADESCHSQADIQRLAPYYGAFNIKLDKSGGLSEAMAMINMCRKLNKDIMLGCMVGSSLSMAPSVLLACYANVIDLDGPALIANDRSNGFTISGSIIKCW